MENGQDNFSSSPKNLIFIGGPMGIGKTTISKYLVENKLDNAAFLDGDWCWYMHPWIFNDENKAMVLDNIQYLLNAFLKNSNIKNIVFCWVMHQQAIVDDVLKKLKGKYNFYSISLISTPEELQRRYQKDVDQDIRDDAGLQGAIERLGAYAEVDSIKVDVTNHSVDETAVKIQELIR